MRCFPPCALLAFAAPAALSQTVTPPPIAAKAYLLVDTLSGQTLAAAAENDRFDPASLTKLMTAYVVFAAPREHKIDLAQSLTPSPHAQKAIGSRMFVEAGKSAAAANPLALHIANGGDAAPLRPAKAVVGDLEAHSTT